jgi:hypothetical protein
LLVVDREADKLGGRRSGSAPILLAALAGQIRVEMSPFAGMAAVMIFIPDGELR